MGADNYKEFDSASIISSAAGKDTITVGKVTVRKREAVLGIIALIALLMVIILAIVLAVEAGKDDDCSSAATSAQTGGASGVTIDGLDPVTGPVGQGTTSTTRDSATASSATSTTTKGKEEVSTTSTIGSATTSAPPDTGTSGSTCISAPCLRAAYYEKVNMNGNADPCDDFYEFACGGYAEANPQSALLEDVTPPKKILLENTERLIYLLDFPVERPDINSYERKLKHFMKSCTDHFERMELRGKPFLEKVLKPFGGWVLLGRNLSDFDFMDQLKKVHIQFWTTAFFRMAVATDQTNWQKKILELDFGGIGVDYRYYGNVGNGPAIQRLYKAYIAQVAQYVIYDAGSTPANRDVIQFADDVYDVEHNLSKVILASNLARGPHRAEIRTTLGGLQTIDNLPIDFVDYFNSIFVDSGAKFQSDTPIAVMRDEYFHKLGPMLNNYLSTADGKRRLHNYLVWQLMNRYTQDLSWEYIHSKRQLNAYLYGRRDDSSGYSYCFRTAERSMRVAMGAVFVKQYFRAEDKSEAIAIMDQVKDQMVSSINNWKWMSPVDRQNAVDKIQNSLYKIGYPDYMTNDNYVDSLYDKANITEKDYFGNILSLNEVHKQTFNDLMKDQNSRHRWAYHVFQPAVEYYNPWHELIATAAVLQNPLFDHEGPKYYNYGGMGSVIATNLMHAVDEIGSTYRLDRNGYGSWWDNSTKTEYVKRKVCAADAQNGEKLGPFSTAPGGPPITVNISLVSAVHAPQLLADSAGLTLAYKAYKAREINFGQEKIPPGFPGYTVDQMFFIAYAQSYCQNTPDYLKYSQLTSYRLPSKNKVNLAVSQVKEFKNAFNCKAGASLAPEKVCSLLD